MKNEDIFDLDLELVMSEESDERNYWGPTIWCFITISGCPIPTNICA